MGKAEGLPNCLEDEHVANFPNLVRANYQVTSPRDVTYNCIAHAAGEDDKWWDPCKFPAPGYYWPEFAKRDADIDSLKSCYQTKGFEVCADGAPEDGFTKIVLYADSNEAWTHAARQVDDGEWTSKLGRDIDIRHKTPGCVGGPLYGEVALFMRKKL